MRIRASMCCIAAFGFWLNVGAARAQSGVLFANYGPGWFEPWYGGVGTNGLYSWGCFNLGQIATGGGRLAGDGFTAELFGGPEGSPPYELQFLARNTFRTGTTAGLLRTHLLVPVPFAQSGQRVALQMRVYDNRGGTLTSWARAMSDTGIVTGMSDVFTSEPLGATPVTLQGMGSYCLTFDGVRLPVPVLTLTTGGIIDLWGRPTPVKHWEPSWPFRSLIAGDTATLTVDVPNPATSVTWSYNGENLPGQTNPSLVLSNIQPAQSGEYSVRVTVNIGTYVFARTTSTRMVVTPRPILEEAMRDFTGAFTARLRGVKNRVVVIESSSDLQHWVRGPWQWLGSGWSCAGDTVTNAPLFGPQLFYRAVVLP